MSFIIGGIIYLLIGLLWSYAIGFRLGNGDYFGIVLLMIFWPPIILLSAAWAIEDIIINLSNRRR